MMLKSIPKCEITLNTNENVYELLLVLFEFLL